MADFSETDPLIEHGDDDHDDDEGATNRFQSSTPGPSGEDIPLTTMNREREKSAEPTTAEGRSSREIKTRFHTYSLQMKGHGTLLLGFFLKQKPWNWKLLTIIVEDCR